MREADRERIKFLSNELNFWIALDEPLVTELVKNTLALLLDRLERESRTMH